MKLVLIGALCILTAGGLGGAFAETPEDAATMHVAPGGDDANPGTAEKSRSLGSSEQQAGLGIKYRYLIVSHNRLDGIF